MTAHETSEQIAREIICSLAQERVVEKIVANVAHMPVEGDLCDLCQMIYETLLNTPAFRLIRMESRGETRFYITKIVTNQIRSKTSQFHYLYRIPAQRSAAITKEIREIADED